MPESKIVEKVLCHFLASLRNVLPRTERTAVDEECCSIYKYLHVKYPEPR